MKPIKALFLATRDPSAVGAAFDAWRPRLSDRALVKLLVAATETPESFEVLRRRVSPLADGWDALPKPLEEAVLRMVVTHDLPFSGAVRHPVGLEMIRMEMQRRRPDVEFLRRAVRMEGVLFEAHDLTEAAADAVLHVARRSRGGERINLILGLVPNPAAVARHVLPAAIDRGLDGVVGNFLTSRLVTLAEVGGYMGVRSSVQASGRRT